MRLTKTNEKELFSLLLADFSCITVNACVNISREAFGRSVVGFCIHPARRASQLVADG